MHPASRCKLHADGDAAARIQSDIRSNILRKGCFRYATHAAVTTLRSRWNSRPLNVLPVSCVDLLCGPQLFTNERF
jgi:hypothetical protein